MNNEKRLRKTEYIGANKHLKVAKRRGADFPMHAHDYFELEIVVSGSGLMHLNGHEHIVTTGFAYILSPSDFHDFSVYDDVTMWNISFDDTLLSAETLEALLLRKPCRVLSANDLQRIDAAATLLEQEVAENGCVAPLIEYISEIIMHGISYTLPTSPIGKAMLYIEGHFRESPSLKEVAEQACLSPVYFGSLFKKTNGETYISYLNSRKLSCAKMLLSEGMSVTEACFASGFGSLSGFLHAFKQKNDMSPEAYRKQQLSSQYRK